MHSPAQLLQPILQAARQQGLDQAALARAAGLSPESISRAKRRASMDLATLGSLAEVAGLEIRVEPRRPATAAVPIPSVRPPSPSTPASKATRRGLADPAWGLAWSNPDGISDSALIRAALRRGNFAVVLEACALHGIDRVSAEWREMTRSASPEPGAAQVDQVERVLRNIRQGQQPHAAA